MSIQQKITFIGGKLEGTKDIENAIPNKVFFLFAPENLTIVEKSC